MTILVNPIAVPFPGELPVEVVERKGRGHPDSICDSLAEELSRALTRFYLEHAGSVLHHNVDKALLCAGSTAPAFGGGEVLAPIEVWLAGRATLEHAGVAVPVADLAEQASRRWLQANLHALDASRHVRLHTRVRPSSGELRELFGRGGGAELSANDTSCGVGYAPLSTLERVVLEVERELTASATVRAHPAIGEDVKIMGLRHGGRIELTIACAIVDRYTPDLDAYRATKETVAGIARHAAERTTTMPLDVSVNAADDLDAGSVYLTVTGTSAEAGDDGQAGRGNRANGLITPCRPMTMESVAGKNPLTHPGKLYGINAGRLADAVVSKVPEITAAQCLMVSRIGVPLSEPPLVEMQVAVEGASVERVRPRVEEVVRAGLERLIRDPLQASLLRDSGRDT